MPGQKIMKDHNNKPLDVFQVEADISHFAGQIV